MKAIYLTPQQRIEILEDVLQKLEIGDKVGGLCLKITASAFELFEIYEFEAKNISPILTLENAKMVTKVTSWAVEGGYWWDCIENYDFENRIKFVNWMINEYK